MPSPRWLLAGVVLVAALQESAYLDWSVLFAWHPLLMTAAFVVLAPAGMAVKRKGPKGHAPTLRVHAALMTSALVLAAAGAAAVAAHKARLRHAHLQSWHARLGALVLGVFAATYAAGACLVACRVPPTWARLRAAHRLAGRAALWTGVVVLGMGWWSASAPSSPSVDGAAKRVALVGSACVASAATAWHATVGWEEEARAVLV